MSWILLADGRIVHTTTAAMLAEPVVTGDPLGGVVVGQGGPRGSVTEHPGNMPETQQIIARIVQKGSNLSMGDPIKFDQHFKDHRDLLIKATGKQFPLTPAGKMEYLQELRNLVARNQLRPIGIATLAKDQPLVFVLRGPVGATRLTLIMKPNGDYQTCIRSGEGLDLRMKVLMKLDGGHPFVAAR